MIHYVPSKNVIVCIHFYFASQQQGKHRTVDPSPNTHKKGMRTKERTTYYTEVKPIVESLGSAKANFLDLVISKISEAFARTSSNTSIY